MVHWPEGLLRGKGEEGEVTDGDSSQVDNVLAFCASESVRIRILCKHIAYILSLGCGKCEVLKMVAPYVSLKQRKRKE